MTTTRPPAYRAAVPAPARDAAFRVLAGAALAAALVLAAAAPAAAQHTAPPPPLPLEDVAFPPFEERTLSGGSRLLVVSQHEVPFVTVNVVFPGGDAAEPPGMEGVAGAMAGLLTKGTETRGEAEIAEAVDGLGAVLGASSSDDWINVSLSVLSPELDQGLDLLADVILHPVFPAEQLEIERQRTLSALRSSLAQPAALAARAFARTLYGPRHPYGRLSTPASVEAWTRDAVVAYQDAWLDPGNALFVVAGDVEADRVAAALEDAFRGWTPGTVPRVAYGPVPERRGTEVVLVHRPGSVQAAVRAGHLLMEGDAPDWTALSVANQVLGGGSSGRLFKVLREERGLTYGASSATSRRRDRGVFVTSLEARNEVAGDAVAGLLEQIRRMRDELVPAGELADTKDFLVGSFPLQIETPQQIAGQVATNRLLGLPDDAMETYRGRVAALDASDVREVARARLHPDRLALVVVGDARVLRPVLQPFGPLTVLDAEGDTLTAADLDPTPTAPETLGFDASGLVEGTYTYRMLFQGQEVGSMVRELSRDTLAPEPALTWAGTASMGPQSIEQSVTFTTPGFRPLRARAALSMGGPSVAMTAEVVDGHLVGEVNGPQGGTEVDRELPEGALLGDMVELAIWLADLEEGTRIGLPVVRLETGEVVATQLRVTGVEEVTVPAGTFQAYRVEVGGAQAQTVWARVEGPHVILRVVPAAQPLTLELASLP